LGRDNGMNKKRGQVNVFELLFDEAPLPYQSLDEGGNILKVNNAWLEVLGYTKEEVIGKWFGDFLANDSVEYFKENFSNFKAVGIINDVDFRAVKNDGEIVHVSVNGKITYDENGKFIRTHCILTDMTAQKKAEMKEKQYFQELEFLSKTAMDFVEPCAERELYQLIGEHMREILGNSIIIVNSFDEKSNSIRTESIVDIGKYSDKILKILGEHPVGKSFPISDEAKAELTKGRLVKVPGKLQTLSFGEIPKAVCHTIEKLLKIDEIYSIGFAREDKLFGNVAIITRNGIELKNINVIETYIGQASVALQRKKAEEALKESENRLNILFESAPDAYYIYDFEGEFIDSNKIAEELIGYSRKELIGKNFVDAGILPRDQIENAMNTLADNINGIATGPDEQTLIRKDGTRVYTEIISHPIKIGGKDRILGIARDITDRKKAEKTLHENEEKFRAVFNDALDGIVLINADNGIIVDANPEFQRIVGRTISQLRTMHIWDARPENEIEQAKRNYKVFTRSDKKLATRNINFQQPSGEVVPVEIKGQNISIRDNIYILSTVRDITYRILAEKEIKSSEERFRNLFEDSLDAVYITDKNATITDMNFAGCDMLGYSKDEIVGKNAILFIINEEDRNTLWKELEEKGSINSFEVLLKKKDGSKIICLVSTTVKKDSAGNITGYQGILHDITNRIIIEKRYRDEFERAEFYNDLMSHDVRNYNQGIMSNLELMNQSRELSEDTKQFSRNALVQVIESSKLITNLQILSDLKHTETSIHDMDVIPFITEAIDYTMTSFPDKKMIVHFPEENSSIIVKGNSLLLEVFNNIMSNAMKFDRNQEVHVEIIISEEDKLHKFEFKDIGPGINDNIKSRIFDRNVRVIEETWGTGLGLTLVKRIVESLNGDVWVEDRIKGGTSKGSNFILLLPRGDIPG